MCLCRGEGITGAPFRIRVASCVSALDTASCSPTKGGTTAGAGAGVGAGLAMRELELAPTAGCQSSTILLKKRCSVPSSGVSAMPSAGCGERDRSSEDAALCEGAPLACTSSDHDFWASVHNSAFAKLESMAGSVRHCDTFWTESEREGPPRSRLRCGCFIFAKEMGFLQEAKNAPRTKLRLPGTKR